MHRIPTEGGGQITWYVRNQKDAAGKWVATWCEVSIEQPNGKHAAVAMDVRRGFEFQGVCHAYHETLRRAMGYDVDAERRRSEKPMSLVDAIWQAWYTIRHRRCVGSLRLETRALHDDLIRLRSDRAAASATEGTE